MLHFSLTLAWIAGLIYATIPSYWLVVHPFADKWRARKGRIYTPLGGFWLLVIFTLGAVTWPWRLVTLYETPWSLLVGGILAALDIYLLRKIGRDFGSDRLIGRHELNPTQQDQRLINTGMHARIRHPIYLAHLIMLLALTLGSGLAVMFGLTAFAVITGALMIRTEEAELEKRFGNDYREYKKRVPAIYPAAKAAPEPRLSAEDATLLNPTASKLRRLVGICDICKRPLSAPHRFIQFATMIDDAEHQEELEQLKTAFAAHDWLALHAFQKFNIRKAGFVIYITRCAQGGMAVGIRDPFELSQSEELRLRTPLTIDELNAIDEIAAKPHWHSF